MKVAKIAIFLTGMIGLAMGGLMSVSSLRSQQEEARIRTYETLKSEAQVLVDQFFGAIEAVKGLSQNNLNASTLPYVTHVGVVKLVQSQPTEFETLATKEQMQLGVDKNGKAMDTLPDLALEERILKALKQTLSYGDLQISKFAIGTFEPLELSNHEGIFIATPLYKTTNGVADPSIIDRVNLTLLDPSKIMASLSKIQSDRRAAYLISRSGKVLAHSSNAFVGSELKKFESLRDPIDTLFLGAQTGVATQYTSVGGRKEQVAFVRAGVYPFAIASERAAPPAILSSMWLKEQVASGAARQNVGMMLVLCALALGLFAGTSIIVTRSLPSAEVAQSREQRAIQRTARSAPDKGIGDENPASGNYAPSFHRWTEALKAKHPEPANAGAIANSNFNAGLDQFKQVNLDEANEITQTRTQMPPEFNTSPSIARAAEKAAESFVENRAHVNEQNQVRQENAKRILVSKDYEREFIERIKSNYTLETIERELTGVSSELTESPVLYFRYHRQTQNLNLAMVSGLVQIPNYALMQAYVRKDIEQQVERLATDGRVASIANYAPVSKLMMANLNTAHFEAWVVTSDAEVSGSSKMVGVIVILQAGFRSAQTRPVLANILKEAGNYLYAQTSKLRPRRYSDQNGNTLPDLNA